MDLDSILNSIFSFFRSTFGIIIIIFIIFCFIMYKNQDNLIFPTSVNGLQYPEDNPDGWKSPLQRGLKYRDISTKTKDGIKLAGWLIFQDENTKSPTLIYFHENAGSKLI